MPGPHRLRARLAALASGLLIFALPCRYTVRDVAYVDLDDPGYRLYCFASSQDSPGLGARVAALGKALYLDANVEVEVVDPASEAGREAADARLAELRIEKLPAAVLVGPDDRAIAVPLGGAGGETFESSGARVLESIVDSPVRREVLEHLLDDFCVVVLVEGRSADGNTRARSEIDTATRELEQVFDRFPKAVGDLPHTVVVPADRVADERVLLWSLGLPGEVQEQAAVAVLFGRGRRVGPVLTGDAVSSANLFGIYANVGQDCECGLDRSWMRGPRIPLRWDEATRTRAVERLGFDPDSPLVRLEISGILRRGPRGAGATSRPSDDDAPSVEELLLGYSEQVVELGEAAAPPEAHGVAGSSTAESSTAESSTAESRTAESSTPDSGAPTDGGANDGAAQDGAAGDGGATEPIWLVLLGLVGLSVAGSLIVLSRARR